MGAEELTGLAAAVAEAGQMGEGDAVDDMDPLVHPVRQVNVGLVRVA